MPKLLFTMQDPANSSVVDSATGEVLYECSCGAGPSQSAHGTIKVRNADGAVVGTCDASLFSPKVVFGERVTDLKKYLARRSMISEYGLIYCDLEVADD